MAGVQVAWLDLVKLENNVVAYTGVMTRIVGLAFLAKQLSAASILCA